MTGTVEEEKEKKMLTQSTTEMCSKYTIGSRSGTPAAALQ